MTTDDVVALLDNLHQEYKHVQKRLRSLGMQLITGHNVVALDRRGAARLRIQRSRAARELCFWSP